MNELSGAPPLLLTMEDAARVLAISRSYVYELVGRGALRTVTIGRARRVPVAALVEYVARLTSECETG
jgi:excisionase family DNA binding protein